MLLNQQRILVTRPAHQAQALCDLVTANGGIAIRFPVIHIQPLTDEAQQAQGILQAYDLAIFISANAVQYAQPILAGHNNAHLQLAAVGNSTANAIRALGYPLPLVPPQDFNSEGLLALPELQHLHGKRVLILRGEGGRELLAQSLRQRGAQVDYLNLYRRCLPALDPAAHPWLANGAIDSIVISSREGLQNLLQLLPNPPWLAAKNWAVMTASIAEQLRQAGMQGRIAVAPSNNDAGLLQALLEMRSGYAGT